MNFKESLHPEIVLDRTGHKLVRKMYKVFLDKVSIIDTGDGLEFEITDDTLLTTENSMLAHVALVKKWLHSPRKIYHIPPAFFDCLKKIDIKIPLLHLPDDFTAYINFSNSYIDDGDDMVTGAYVYCGSLKNSIMAKKYEDIPDKKCLWFSYVGHQIGQDPDNPRYGDFKVILEDGMSIMDAIDTIDYQYRKNDDGTIFTDIPEEHTIKRSIIYRTLLNTILYINSAEPILEHCQPFIKRKGKMSKTKLRKMGKSVNETSLQVTLVNSHYHKDKLNYTDATTHVHSFVRWQRCGPNFSQIKLVWVKDHERVYKKVIE